MATGQGPIYDDAVTFPTNKTDGGAPSTPQTWPALDANNQGSFNYAARTAIRSGIYHGALDQSGGLPPLSSGAVGAKSTNWTSNGGQLAASEGGGPYVWIHSTNYINFGDKRFGAVSDWNGSTGTDNTAALNAAIAATIRTVDATGNRVLYIPEGQWRLRSPVTIAACRGFRIEGEGEWASKFIIDPAVANGDGLKFNSSIGIRLAGFALIGRSANPAGKMLSFTYSPIVYASYDHHISNLKISSDDARLAYDTGIWWDNAYGNNSEVQYNQVNIERFITTGVSLPGSQQYQHNFLRCDINGAWDGTDHTTNGGQYGINSGGGQFTFRDGAVTAIRGACFYVHAALALAVVVDGCDTEVSYQIFGDGNPGNIASTSGYANTIYRNSRYSANANSNMDPDKVISFNAGGTFVIEDNLFFNGGTNQPKIMFYPNTSPRGISVKRNIFQTANSALYDPIVVLGTVNYRALIDCRDNLYVNASYNQVERNEVLNVAKTDAMLMMGAKAETSSELLYLDLTQFKAAAPSQDIELQTGRPQGITYEAVIAQLYNYIIVTGAIAITCRIGTTSGGQELIKDFVVGGSGVGDFHAIYGALASERGTDMPGHCPNFRGTSSVWVRLTAASGNLGNGTTSIITRGIIHLATRSHLQLRSIT